MSKARERFRSVLSRDTCTVAANIFDPLSARIAEMLNYEVCLLSGSVGKAANLGVPDLVMYNMSDAVDHCRRITRMADVSLMLDGEDGFGNAVNTIRTVREFESAGVSAIEIEDSKPPDKFDGPDPGLYSKTEQVGKLTAASSARRDPGTVIVARTAALAQCPLEEALDRISAYSTTGVEAIRLTGIKTEIVVRATWVLGASLATAAGVFLGWDSHLHSMMGFYMLLPMFAAAILGGIGQPYGAMVGGLVVGLAEELSAYPWIGDSPLLSPAYKAGVAFALMIIMLIWRPSGLFKGRVF